MVDACDSFRPDVVNFAVLAWLLLAVHEGVASPGSQDVRVPLGASRRLEPPKARRFSALSPIFFLACSGIKILTSVSSSSSSSSLKERKKEEMTAK